MSQSEQNLKFYVVRTDISKKVEELQVRKSSISEDVGFRIIEKL